MTNAVATHTSVLSSTAPEPGQLVEVCRRQWIISDDASAVSPDLPKLNLVKLASFDEDAPREGIQVLWELEPGAHIIERAGLPTISALDDPSKLEAFLDAVRWGAATNADRGYLQASFRSGASIEDYQLDLLVRAIDIAGTNLLIDDDVGLGKTIEMLLRHRARTILVLCRSSLQEKWRSEMAEKFGLEFRIVDTDSVKRSRRERGLHSNPWTSFPRLIDWAKQGEVIRLLRDVLPPQPTFPRRFDMLVVDDTHNVAPLVGKCVVESLRTRLVRLLAPHFQHKLFLTAMPHDGYTESFTALLALLDEQLFSQRPPAQRQTRARDGAAPQERPHRRQGQEALPSAAPRSAEHRVHRRGARDSSTPRTVHRGPREAGRARWRRLALRPSAPAQTLAPSPGAFMSTLARHTATIEGKGEPRRTSGLHERILRRAIAKTAEQVAARIVTPRAAKSRAKSVPAGQGALAPIDASEAEPKHSETKADTPAKNASIRRTSK